MTDLRLVPAALAAWATAFVAVGASAADALHGARATAVVLCCVLVAGLVALRRGATFPAMSDAGVGAGLVTVPSGPATGAGPRRSGGPRLGAPVRPREGRPVGPGTGSSVGVRVLGQVALVLACVAAVLLSGGVQLAARAPLAALADERATATLAGTVRSAVEPRTDPWSGSADRHEVRVAVDQVTARGATVPAAGPVVVSGSGEGWTDLAYGAAVVVTGRLDVQGDRTFLRTDGAPRVVDDPGRFLQGVHAMRQGLLDATDGLSPQARGLVPGVAVGDTSRLDSELDEAMRTTSLTHVTAVSGGHFVIVVACVAALCVLLRAPRAVRVVVTGAAMVGFVALVHPEPSVLRAAAMGVVGVLGIALGRPSRAVAALGAAVVVLLVVDPWLARSYGFVLSVAATAGLALLTAPIARRLAPWCGRTAAHVLAVPVAAQAACAPIVVLLDPSVSTWSVPANLLATPALGPATVLGVLATLVAPWWPGAATALAWTAGLFTGWIAGVAQVFAATPGARAPWPGGFGGATLLAALTAVGLAVVLRSRALQDAGERRTLRRATSPSLRARLAGEWRRATRPSRPDAGPFGRTVGAHPALAPRARARSRARVAAVVALVAVPVLLVVVLRPLGVTAGPVPADWAVVACDVGQGDALVVRSGPRAAVVVDVGPAGAAAGSCLDDLGVERVDLLVLSHFHADHVGGLEAVLRGREVGRALVSPTAEPAPQAERVLGDLADAGVPVQVARPGETGSAGSVGAADAEGSGESVGDGASWEVLQAGPGDANDASVALLVRVAGLDVVALGDLEDAGQAALARTLGERGTGPVDVVKVAHHGSATQSDRLAQVLAPTVALVSSGENTYGHPTDRALDLYRGVGATVLRTDACGTVALVVRDDVLSAAGCG
ncbi:ComEC/Rec2 family competence protein [Cellulosimicrobium cellulans]|uniref:ComEC/Rec2 family competence protein n=1 Tax=Cellulosimicrobium cellulans TaxID=1710 RepID=UPI001BA4AD29|nr:ComEC/Rec2 family competence protein [Cellulosimicrobium cellulans]QUC00334.1 ComEC/Rec2 family competence protein [Cellulosimicrobium cellulans]